jgi:hypothetical protein
MVTGYSGNAAEADPQENKGESDHDFPRSDDFV